MRRPLLWLFVATRRNAVLRFLAGLKRPRRLLGVLAAVGGLAMFVTFSARAVGDLPPPAVAGLLVSLLALTLVLGVFGGLSERGIAFQPAEVDFLFPGPFRPRDLVAYRVAAEDGASIFSALLFFAIAGAWTDRPVLALVGILLCGATVVHVRLFVALLATQIADAAYRRIRGPLRLVTTLAALALGGVIFAAVAQHGGIRDSIASAASSPATRAVFYPAAVVGDLAQAPSLAAALPSLLGAAAVSFATLLALLLLQVNFLEASLGASARAATVRAAVRQRKAWSVGVRGTKPRPARASALPVFRGAGAIAWKNLLGARRSSRALFFSAVLVGVFVLPVYLGARDMGEVAPIVATALLPLFLSSTLSFDFRGETANMALLKTLPLSAFRMAAAQVSMPALVALVFQAMFVGILVAVGRLPLAWLPLALLAYPPVTVSLVASANLAHLLAPRLRLAEGLLQMVLVIVLLVVVGLVSWGLDSAGFGIPAIAAGVLLAGTAVAWGLLHLVALAFSAHDVAKAG